MTDSIASTNNIGRLREDIRPAVQFLMEKLGEDLVDQLVSLSVVGSALTSDFHPTRSDINTVLVVSRRSHHLLQLLGGYGKSMGKRKLRAPLLMTSEYICQSLDVFGVELLEFQHNHQTVLGPDAFNGLSFRKEDVRLQCERQLKAALIKLRQGYIRVMGKYKYVASLLIECISELAVLLRAMLWLGGNDRPAEAVATIELAAKVFEFDDSKLLPLMKMRLGRTLPSSEQVETIFEDVYQVIDLLGRKVDQIGGSGE